MNDLASRLTPEALQVYANEIQPDLEARRVAPALVDLFRYDYETVPVSVKTFITDEAYLGGAVEDSVYPGVIEDLQKVFDGEYDEVLCAGGIGWGKSREVELGILYEIYCTSCLRDPAKTYGLMPGSTLAFLNVSVKKDQAKRVLFAGMFDIMRRSRYFREKFPHQPNLKSEIKLPKNIACYPVAANETSMLGEGVFSAVIDEANFMAIVEKSKRTRDTGTYDQVVVLYDKIKTRIRSRTNQRGRLPGHVWIISSARYPNDFTERLEIEAITDHRICVNRHATWETHPKSKYMEQTFEVEVGDKGKKSRVLSGNETDVKRENVYKVPMDFKPQFVKNPDKEVRDTLGRPTLAIRPYFSQREKIAKMFQMGEELELLHPFTKHKVTLQNADEKLIPNNFTMLKIPVVNERDQPLYDDHGAQLYSFKLDPGPYFSHNDGAKNIDSWGHCVTHIVGQKFCERTAGDPMPELRPIIRVAMILEIVAPYQGNIGPQHVRGLYYQMAALGMHFRLITYDTFGSMESISILNEEGYNAEVFSVDRSPEAYETLKVAMDDERVQCYYVPKLENELLYVEWDELKGKIEHPALGSKDLADALAAAVHHAERAFYSGLRVTDKKPIMVESDAEKEPGEADEELWDKLASGTPLTPDEMKRMK